MVNPSEDVRPVQLDLMGDWWDCHLYAGRLYLVTIDGDVLDVNWPRLVDSLITSELDRLALDLSFIDARYLYNGEWDRLLRDVEVGSLLRDKLNRIANLDLEVDAETLVAFGDWHRKVLPEALSDVDIHRSTFYAGSSAGLETADLRWISNRQKHWDGHPSEIRASRGGMLAIAAGPDGLRQAITTVGGRRLVEPGEVLRGDFTGCSWLHASIYGSSHVNAGALAVFSHQRRERPGRQRTTVRTFEARLDDSDIFDRERRRKLDETLRDDPSRRQATTEEQEQELVSENVTATRFESRYKEPPTVTAKAHGFSWAGDDRICRAVDQTVTVVHFQGRSERYSRRIRPAESFRLDPEDAVIGGDVAPFGVLVETEDDLLVLTSTGVTRLEFAPVRWRTYPRATNYPNQLHVIGEDRIRMLSFLNDDVRRHGKDRPGASFIGRGRRG